MCLRSTFFPCVDVAVQHDFCTQYQTLNGSDAFFSTCAQQMPVQRLHQDQPLPLVTRELRIGRIVRDLLAADEHRLLKELKVFVHCACSKKAFDHAYSMAPSHA